MPGNHLPITGPSPAYGPAGAPRPARPERRGGRAVPGVAGADMNPVGGYPGVHRDIADVVAGLAQVVASAISHAHDCRAALKHLSGVTRRIADVADPVSVSHAHRGISCCCSDWT